MPNAISNFFKFILPKGKNKKGGTSATSTFNPSAKGGAISVPLYRDHLVDLLTQRTTDDSRTLIEHLMVHDPDMSAALNAFLTVANTKPIIVARDIEGNIDPEGLLQVQQILRVITARTDYSTGFQITRSLEQITADMRYMALLRGAVISELVFDKNLVPSNIRTVDSKNILWFEKTPGEYKISQKVPGQNKPVPLDFPTIFVGHFRKIPTKIYSESFFVSAITTISARAQVINDLYRIMRLTGFPRIDVEVIEEILIKNAPGDVKQDQEKLRQWVATRFNEISGTFAGLRADQPFIHSDSVKVAIMNDRAPGAALQIQDVITTLNSQNQAGLKTMATIIGRGEAGVNTAAVEARIFSMSADELNTPVASSLSQILTFALQIYGFQGFVDVTFAKAELRPETELEPQILAKSSRLKQDLSLGLITDEEYHLAMYHRPRPKDAPELAGTGFMKTDVAATDVSSISPNSDPLGRSITSKGNKVAKSNQVKK